MSRTSSACSIRGHFQPKCPLAESGENVHHISPVHITSSPHVTCRKAVRTTTGKRDRNAHEVCFVLRSPLDSGNPRRSKLACVSPVALTISQGGHWGKRHRLRLQLCDSAASIKQPASSDQRQASSDQRPATKEND